MFTRRAAIVAGAAAPWLADEARAADPPTIEALVRRPALLAASLSPDGETIAVLRQQAGAKAEDKGFAFVDLYKAADPKAKPARVTLGELTVTGLNWAGNSRLLIGLLAQTEQTFRPTEGFIESSYQIAARRLMSVGIDGKGAIILFADDRAISRIDPDLSVIIDRPDNDPGHILMRAFNASVGAYGLYRVDVVSGAHEMVEKGTVRTGGWFMQDGRAVARLDSAGRSSAVLLSRPPGQSDWKIVRKIRRETELVGPDFELVGPTPELGVFLARTAQPGDTALALRRFNLFTGEVGDVVASRPDRDVEGVLIDGVRRLVATRYRVDRVDYDFSDPAVAPHFRAIDRFLRGEANAALVDCDRAHNRFIVNAHGPRVAGAYYFYDKAAQRMEALGLARPWLSLDSLAPVEMLDVRTRDGAVLRAYLTVPRAEGPRPLVVLPHGGPESRDAFDFDVFAQALAAQGWLVLQPNFRGSGGYGRAFLEAGRRRWGERMQEDVEDAVDQVLASGRADKTRVAICGASYGGYAALMGAVRRPALYRAVVSIAGVSDLADMLAYEREGGEDEPVYQYWLKVIGDPKADADQLRRWSPRFQSAHVAAPVLLIHGLADRTVPARQSRFMAQSLKAAGQRFDHTELPQVGHRGWKPEVMRQVLEQSTAFIAKAFA